MFRFNLADEPLTNLELKAELQRHKDLRTVQIKYSCVSDVLHAFIFIALYFNHFLSGYAILVAVGLSTVVALLLATVPRQTLIKSDMVVIVLLSAGTAMTSGILLSKIMNESFIGSFIAALAAGSIVIIGATLGRKIKKVLTAIESMKPIIDDEISWQNVMTRCRKFPELDEYRQSAAQNLRPHLTYGELEAMEKWGQEQI
jgi:hypothetical protein